MDQNGAEKSSEGLFATKLQKLYDRKAGTSEGKVNDRSVSEGIFEATGYKVTRQYLNQLRTGERDNPCEELRLALAEYFGVNSRYLALDKPYPDIDSQLDLAAALNNAGVRDIALRSHGLRPEDLTFFIQWLDHTRVLRKLPPVGQEEGHGPA